MIRIIVHFLAALLLLSLFPNSSIVCFRLVCLALYAASSLFSCWKLFVLVSFHFCLPLSAFVFAFSSTFLHLKLIQLLNILFACIFYTVHFCFSKFIAVVEFVLVVHPKLMGWCVKLQQMNLYVCIYTTLICVCVWSVDASQCLAIPHLLTVDSLLTVHQLSCLSTKCLHNAFIYIHI